MGIVLFDAPHPMLGQTADRLWLVFALVLPMCKAVYMVMCPLSLPKRAEFLYISFEEGVPGEPGTVKHTSQARGRDKLLAKQAAYLLTVDAHPSADLGGSSESGSSESGSGGNGSDRMVVEIPAGLPGAGALLEFVMPGAGDAQREGAAEPTVTLKGGRRLALSDLPPRWRAIVEHQVAKNSDNDSASAATEQQLTGRQLAV
jgi:hypothetical protein